MREVLLDTHALLWWLRNDPSLSPRARQEIEAPDTDVVVSTVCVWEIAIKRSIGKLKAPDDLLDAVELEGFGWLSVHPAHAWEVDRLPAHHGDPFDRMLIAQARVEGIPIVTGDPRFAAYGVAVRW